MKHVSIAALGIALALGVTASPALAKDKPAKEAPVKPSDAVIKQAQAIQGALAKKDFATAKPLVDALAATVTTDEDKFYVGHWLIQVGQGTSDMAELGKGVDMTLSTSKTSPEELKSLTAAQGKFAYQAKDYAKAAVSFQRAIDAGSTDPDLTPLLVESLRLSNQGSAALKALTDSIARQQAANQPVDPAWYGRGYVIAYSAKPSDSNFAAMRQQGIELSKKWVAAQPTGAVWHDSLLLYRDSAPQDSDLKLDIFRLDLAANALHGGNEYLEYIEAIYQRYPGEAKTVINTGVSKGALTLASNRNASEINAIVTGKIAADKASLAGSDKSARAAATGKAALSTADAYYGYGDFAKAIDLYNVALQKGGVDANVINTRLGEAQYGAGDKAAAKASFAKLTGTRKDLGDFWITLIDHPAAG